MPTAVLDQVRGAELEMSRQSGRYVRQGWINDIELADTPDPDALVKCLPYLPAFDSSLGPQSPGLKLTKMRIRPSNGKIRRVDCVLLYETITIDATPTAYLLRDRTYTVQKQTGFIPGTRQPIMVEFDTNEPSIPVGSSQWIPPIPAQPLFFNVDISARAIQLTILQYGRATAGAADYVNYVNDDTWPSGTAQFPTFQSGLSSGTGVTQEMQTATSHPKGYWKLMSYGSEFDRSKGMTLTQAEAATKIIEDWSQEGYMQDPRTGKYPFAGLSQSDRDSTMADLTAPEYARGIIYPTSQVHKGVIRFGAYPLTDFASLFGF